MQQLIARAKSTIKVSKNGHNFDLSVQRGNDIIEAFNTYSPQLGCELQLKPDWLDPKKVKPESTTSMYWVRMPDGSVHMCYLNDYSSYGGASDCWQRLNNDDIPFNETQYIEIKKPE